MEDTSNAPSIWHHLITAVGFVVMTLGLASSVTLSMHAWIRVDQPTSIPLVLWYFARLDPLLILMLTGPGAGIILFQRWRNGPTRSHFKVGVAVTVIGLLLSTVFFVQAGARTPHAEEYRLWLLDLEQDDWEQWQTSGIPSEHQGFIREAEVSIDLDFHDAMEKLRDHQSLLNKGEGGFSARGLMLFFIGIVGLFLAFINRTARDMAEGTTGVEGGDLPDEVPTSGTVASSHVENTSLWYPALTIVGCVLMTIGLFAAYFVVRNTFSSLSEISIHTAVLDLVLVVLFAGPGAGLILFQVRRQGPSNMYIRYGAAAGIIGLMAAMTFYLAGWAMAADASEFNAFVVELDKDDWERWQVSGVPREYEDYVLIKGFLGTHDNYNHALKRLTEHRDELVKSRTSLLARGSFCLAIAISGLFLAVANYVNMSKSEGPRAEEEKRTPAPETPTETVLAEESAQPAETREKVEKEVEALPPEKEKEEKEKEPPAKAPVAETAPPSSSASGGNTPLIAAGLIIAILAIVYLSGMTGPSHPGPHGKVVSWEPSTFTLNTPSTITATFTNDGTDKGTFIIFGQFVKNRVMHVAPSTAKWEKEDLTKTVDLAPGEEKTIKAFTLTPKERPTGDFGFRVRIYRTDTAGEREKIEDSTIYKDVTVS